MCNLHANCLATGPAICISSKCIERQIARNVGMQHEQQHSMQRLILFWLGFCFSSNPLSENSVLFSDTINTAATFLTTILVENHETECWQKLVAMVLRGGWGGVLNNVLYGDAPPRDPTLTLLYTVYDRKGYPFNIYLP